MDGPPLGPDRHHDSVPWGTDDERIWMNALIAALRDFRIVAPVTDTRLNETYHNTNPFVEDFTYYLTHPPRRHDLRVYLAHMMTIIETANRYSAQPAYACIVQIYVIWEYQNKGPMKGQKALVIHWIIKHLILMMHQALLLP